MYACKIYIFIRKWGKGRKYGEIVNENATLDYRLQHRLHIVSFYEKKSFYVSGKNITNIQSQRMTNAIRRHMKPMLSTYNAIHFHNHRLNCHLTDVVMSQLQGMLLYIKDTV